MSYNIRINGNSITNMNGLFAGTMLFISIIWLILIAFKIVSRWLYFKKCGEEGWKALIPIYTDITLVKTSSLNWWWILPLYATTISTIYNYLVEYNVLNTTLTLGIISPILSLLSLVAIFAKFNIGYNICKKFNISFGFAFVIALVEPIGLMILALSKSYSYDSNIQVSPNGVFKSTSDNVESTTNTTTKSSDIMFCEKCGNKIEKDSIYCGNCGNKVR